jgi:hypothetical protein
MTDQQAGRQIRIVGEGGFHDWQMLVLAGAGLAGKPGEMGDSARPPRTIVR